MINKVFMAKNALIALETGEFDELKVPSCWSSNVLIIAEGTFEAPIKVGDMEYVEVKISRVEVQYVYLFFGQVY